jgi:hypothetical protein
MGITCNAIRPSAATRMTAAFTGAGEQPAAPSGEFDARDPVHIGEFVSYLASDAAQWISGQVFAVYGDRLHLTKGWHVAQSIEKPGKGWTAEELVGAMPKLAGMSPVSMIEQLGFG